MSMNWIFRPAWVARTICACFFHFLAVGGNGQEVLNKTDPEMPLSFQVSEATIEMYGRGGYAVGIAVDTIILRGSGEGERTEIRSAWGVNNKYRIHYSADDFVGLLRMFFVNQFFTFGPNYTGYQSLMDPANDGTVQLLQTVTVDAGTIALVVRINDYVKSISFIPGKDSNNRKPACLDSLTQEVEYFAEKHAIADENAK